MKQFINIFTFIILSISILSCEKNSIIGQTDSDPSFLNTETSIFEYDTTEYNTAISLINQLRQATERNEKSTKSTATMSYSLSSINKMAFKNVNEKDVKMNDIDTMSVNTEDSVKIYTIDLQIGSESGFAIASGDERIGRVYAYVENGSLSDTSYIKGMAEMISDIPKICQQDLYEYYNEDSTSANTTMTTKSTASTTTEVVGPLLATEWSQKSPYNYATPSNGACTKTYYYAGCGVIAVAQAIAYYGQCNKDYDFEALTAQSKIYTSSSTYLKNEVSSFVGYIGSLSNANYTCDGTSTTTTKSRDVLSGQGYHVRYLHGPRYNNNIKYYSLANEDVILVRGSNSDSGHMWIFDGYTKTSKRKGKIVKTTYTIHCNWGWGGTANGWYANYFVPTYANGVVINTYTKNKGYIYFNL